MSYFLFVWKNHWHCLILERSRLWLWSFKLVAVCSLCTVVAVWPCGWSEVSSFPHVMTLKKSLLFLCLLIGFNLYLVFCSFLMIGLGVDFYHWIFLGYVSSLGSEGWYFSSILEKFHCLHLSSQFLPLDNLFWFKCHIFIFLCQLCSKIHPLCFWFWSFNFYF